MNHKGRLVFLALSLMFATPKIHATPVGGVVTNGNAIISQPNPATTTITQFTDKAILNWNSFSINPNELVQFLQPATTSTTLNRIVGVDPSFILGALRANGRLFLINPNGILFGPSAAVDVGGLLATTLALSNTNFITGNYTFSQLANTPLTSVVNQGMIRAENGGSIVFLAPLVSNEGVMLASEGRIGLGAATQAVVNFDGVGLINFVMNNPSSIPQNVMLSPQAFSQVIQNVVNNKDVVQANAVVQSNGQIMLTAGEGIAINSGTLKTNGSDFSNAGSISVNSTQGTVLTPTSVIQANGVGINSSGGRVRIFSEGNTDFASGSQIQALGGSTGNGGFVETSAANNLWVNGSVDTTAVNGKRGTWLLDPTNITIVDSVAGTGTLDPNVPNVLFATLDNGADTISAGTLETQNSNITLQATNSITVNNIVSNAGNIQLQNNVSLTLQTTGGNITFANTANTITACCTGGITINSGGNATLGNLVTTGIGSINVTAVGNITYNTITSGGNATLTSTTGSINPLAAGTNLQGQAVTLSAQQNIGTAGTSLGTSTPSLTAATSGVNNAGIYINNTTSTPGTINLNTAGNNSPIISSNTGPLTSLTLATANDDITFNQTGSTGALSITTINGSADVTTSLGESFHSIDTPGPSVDNLTVNFPNTDVSFKHSSSIINSGVTNNITAKSLTLEILDAPGESIGTAIQPLLTTTASLTIIEDSAGDVDPIYVTNTGTLNTLRVTVGLGDAHILTTTGDSLQFNLPGQVLTMSMPNTDVTFTSDNQIFNNGALNSITAKSLNVGDSGVGTAVNPLQTTVGALTVRAGGGAASYVANTGALSSLNVTADGDAHITTTLGEVLDFSAVGDDLTLVSFPNTNVSFTNVSGPIVNDGALNVITAKTLNLTSTQGFGTVGQALLMTTGALTTNAQLAASPTHITNTGDLSSLNVTTNASNVNISTTTGKSLTFNGGTSAFTANFPTTDVAFTNSGGAIDNSGAANNVSVQSLNLQAQSGIGTAGQALLTTTTGSITAATINAASPIYLTDAATPASLNVTTQNSNITVNAPGGALTFAGGALTSTLSNVPLTVSVNGSLTSANVTTNNQSDVINYALNGVNQAINFASSTDVLGTTNAQGTTLSFTNSGGNLFLSTINLCTTANLTATASGVLTNSGASANLTANVISLTGSTIGTASTPMNLNATTNQLNATSNNGVVNITSPVSLTLGSVSAGGSGNNVVISDTGGSILGVAGNSVSGNSVNLSALNGIGSAVQSINTTTPNLTLSTTTNGTAPIFANDRSASSTSATTNNSGMTLGLDGGLLTFNGGTNLVTGTSNATNVSLTNTGGNFVLGTVNVGGANSLSLTTSGSITSRGFANNITANTASLNAGSGVGTLVAPITGTISLLNGTSSSGGINFSNTGDLTIGSLTSAGGISLWSTGSLYQSVGGFLSTGGNSSLLAQTGVIGTVATPFNVNVLGGSLSLLTGGAQSGIGAELTGNFSLLNSINVLGYARGSSGFYDHICIFGCTLSLNGVNVPDSSLIATTVQGGIENFEESNPSGPAAHFQEDCEDNLSQSYAFIPFLKLMLYPIQEKIIKNPCTQRRMHMIEEPKKR